MKLKRKVESLDGLPEAIAALYAKAADGSFVLETEGDEDVSGLKSALERQKGEMKTLKDALKEFDGMDPKAIKELLSKFEGDEESQLIKSGKFDVVIEKRVAKMKADFEKKLKTAEETLAATNQKAAKWTQRVLDGAIREAAAKAGLHQHGTEDAMFRARSMFTLDDDGNAVQVVNGEVVKGKDGKSPFTPSEWLDSMRETAPHWFPPTGSGSGAPPQGSGRPGASGGKTIKRSEFDKQTPAEKAATAQAASKGELSIVD